LLLPARGAMGQADEVPSASVKPEDADGNDPNGGQWFVMTLAPGQTGRAAALISNPAKVPQKFTLSLRDVTFKKDGTYSVNEGPPKDVAAWGRFLQPEVRVESGQTVRAEFEITPPPGAEPGDHVGAILVTSEPEGTTVAIIKQVAVRLYVTVPGDTTRAFEIDRIESIQEPGFFMFKGTLSVTVTLKNTGRVRVHPKTTVRGTPAKGPDTLLSRAFEKYLAEVKIPWYGMWVRLPVQATAEGGLIRKASKTVFVFPWGLVLALLGLAASVFGMRYWLSKRASRMGDLRADIRRLESLVTQRPSAATDGPPAEEDAEAEEVAAILAAWKRARRTGSTASMARLALALHETTADALSHLLEALTEAVDPHKQSLVETSATYGKVAILADSHASKLDADTLAQLIKTAEVSTPRTKPAKPKKPKPKSPRSTTAKTKTSRRTFASPPPAKKAAGKPRAGTAKSKAKKSAKKPRR